MKNTKKIVKVTVTISVFLIFIWLGIFTTDFIRCSSLKSPIFVRPSDDIADDGGSGTYNGLGYTVKVKKHISVEDGKVLESVEMRMFGKVVSASIQ